MPLSSRQIIKLLENAGWFHCKTTGSHYHFKHPEKTGQSNGTPS